MSPSGSANSQSTPCYAMVSKNAASPLLQKLREFSTSFYISVKTIHVYCMLLMHSFWEFRGHSRSSKAAPFDIAHTTLYSSSIVNMSVLYVLPFPRYCRIFVENCYPIVFGAPVRGEAVRFTKQSWRKLEWWAYQTVKEIRWYVQPFWYKVRVWRTERRTDRRTDRRKCLGIYAL